MDIFVNKFDFIALCQKYTVDPAIVMEDNKVHFVVETSREQYDNLKELLEESY